jgi:hypothetical protein
MRLLVVIALVAACGGTQTPRDKATDDDAVIKLECAVEQAEVYVNDRQIGQCGDLPGGIALSPGTHRIEVRHDDYHTAYYELTLAVAERKTLQVDLAPALP